MRNSTVTGLAATIGWLGLVIALTASGVLERVGAEPVLLQVQLPTVKDNTLYQDINGNLSNGAGEHFFAGSTGTSSLQRGVIAFDIAGNIPAGSTISTVTLRLHMSRTNFIAAPETIELHRLLADWGEATSDAAGEEGGGAAAIAGDATWLHRFFNTDNWATPGGNFSATVSGVQTVGVIGDYTWTSTQMVQDVQAWLDNPSTKNFGWLVLGNENASTTSKRFDTHENTNPANRPVLIIDYSLQPANNPPVANSQTVTGDHNTPIDITLTGSDSDTGDAMSFSISSLPGSGDLSDGGTSIVSTPFSLSGDMVTYTPQPGFSGTESFSFKASDGKASSDAATVTVNVNPPPAISLNLSKDSNLVSLPLQGIQTSPVADVVASLGGNLTRVYCYDATSPSNPWGVYNPAAPPFAQSLDQIKPTEGCWFLMGTGDTLALEGVALAVDHTFWSLVNGWQLVGWGAEATGDPAAIASALGGTVRIYGYNPAVPANPWKIYDSSAPPLVNTLQELERLKGYWLYYEAPTPIQAPSGAVGWWPGDGHTNDITGSNHGALVANATYAPGLVGQAFSLDGVNDYVDLGDGSSVDFTNQDFTIDAWFRILDYPTLTPWCAPRYPIFSNYAWGYQTEIMGDGHVQFTKYYEFAAAVTVSSLDPVSTGDWHHVAAVHKLTELRIYVDGQLSNTADSPSGAIFYNSNGFDRPEIGRYSCNDPPDFYFKGLIDELEVFDRALSDEEIGAIYGAGSSGKVKPAPPQPAVLPAGVLSWWHAEGDAADSSDGLNGTLVNGASFSPGIVGQAFSLDGLDDYVAFGDISDLDFTDEDFSIEGWFRIPDYPTLAPGCAPRYPLFSNYAWGYSTQILGDGRLYFYKYYEVAASVFVISPDPVSTGDWHHFAAVHTLTELRLYIDGQIAITADSPSSAVFYHSNGFDKPEIGRYSCGDPPDFYFKGVIDELTIYGRAITDAEIKSVYDAAYAGKVEPPP